MTASESASAASSTPFRGGGDAGAVLRSLDWSASLLGEPPDWPEALRGAVTLLLASRHPMMVVWGPHRVCLYNDAFRQSLGPEKHPRAMAQPLRSAFPESHAIFEAQFASVLAGEGAIWRQNELIPIHRHGLLTDAFWTYSATPIESGESIGGVFFICEETTGAVRREQLLVAEDESLRMALDSGRIGSWVLDLRSRAFDATASCKINFGQNPHAALSFAQLKAAIVEEDQARLESAIQRAIDRGEDYEGEYRVVRSDTREGWVLMRGRVAYDVQGEPMSMAGISMDITGRKHTEEHLRLMVDELNHRVKNTLATVQSISHQTLRHATASADIRQALESRLMALSSAHDILTDEQWSGADLLPVLRGACLPFGPMRFDLSGPSVRVTPRIAIALALATHELCTNAVKYGGLSTDEGRVSISWGFRRDGDDAELEIVWRESGGPPVVRPTRRGFGSRMIERSLAPELGGRVEIDFAPAGLVCTLGVRLSDAVLKAKGTRLRVARDGSSWTVSDEEGVLQWFEAQAEAIAYLTEQLNALRVKGRSGTVMFDTSGPDDPPRRARARRRVAAQPRTWAPVEEPPTSERL